MLIYPRHQYFAAPLPVFRFDEDLSLWCVPFDLESGGLVKGEWQDSFSCFPEDKPEFIYDEQQSSRAFHEY